MKKEKKRTLHVNVSVRGGHLQSTTRITPGLLTADLVIAFRRRLAQLLADYDVRAIEVSGLDISL